MMTSLVTPYLIDSGRSMAGSDTHIVPDSFRPPLKKVLILLTR